MIVQTLKRKKSAAVRQKQFWLTEPHNVPLPRSRGLVVDGFAGGGGASEGIRWALGRDVDIAINHDRDAIAMHMANHPTTRHYCENIFDVDPDEVAEGCPIDLAWFSPDCTHFSRARGSKPVKKEIRGLANAILPWARLPKGKRPRVIFVENVAEFQTWGPTQLSLVTQAGSCGPFNLWEERPIPERAGEYFAAWVQQLRGAGYAVEYRELVASDFGAATTRKRLFVVARCDGRPIVWPSPTHGRPSAVAKNPALKLWSTAAEKIDWTIPCPSLFLSPEEAAAAGCRRPLAEKTLARIAEGIRRYVIETPEPFIVRVNHGGDHWRGQGVAQPLATNTNTNGFGLVTPLVTSYYGPKSGDDGHRGRSVCEPVRTVTTTMDKVVVSPYLVALQNGGSTRCATSPIHTITASDGDCNCVVSPLLSRMFGKSVGNEVDGPVGTFTAENKTALVSAFIAKHFGGMVGIPGDRPFPTVTTVGTQNQLVAATMVNNNHGDKPHYAVDEPLRTVVAGGQHHMLVNARLEQVRAFLFRYFGSGGQWGSVAAPAATITTKDRLALGIVLVQGEAYQIVDIGMRMLTPRELFLCQGFRPDYRIEGEEGQPLSKKAQVARVGNSVPPHFSEALVRANLPEICC